MKRFQMLLAAFAVTLVSVSCTPTTTPASTTTSEVAASSTSTSIVQNNDLILVDANGVELGKYLTPDSFYNQKINRIVVFSQSTGRLLEIGVYFKQPECIGQKYLYSPNQIRDFPYIYLHTNGNGDNYIVENNTPAIQTIPLSIYVDGTCRVIDYPSNFLSGVFYELKEVQVDYDNLLNFPLKFKS